MKIKLSNLASLGVLGLSLLGAAGCSKSVDTVFRRNLPPEVRLTQAPVNSQDQFFYAYRMNWVGYDPDGRVDHFLISVDPPRPDSVDTSLRNDQGRAIWSPTNKNEEVVFFRATQPESARSAFLNGTDFHVFAIAAVDDKGAISKPVWRSFFSYTQAPRVFIETPAPNSVFTPIVTPVVRISWRGVDPDGQFTTKPVKYRYRLFGKNNPDFPSSVYNGDFVSFIQSNPNFLRWMYAPTFGPSEKCPTCTAWDSSSAETTEVQYTNLIPDQLYIFAVTGFDEAGAYDPIFSMNTNVLRFAVTYAGTLGPQICMFNEFFNFCYETGGYANDETRYFNVEVPENSPVTFYWFAIPPPGADMRRYRWVLDLQDLTDETPRTPSEDQDPYHWSAYSLNTISATLPGFSIEPSPDHLFFIEAEDNNGLRSLGIIHFTVVRATFENELLFVDDTRMTPDAKSLAGPIEPPRGTWPTAAELDTFFFAKGGYPWRDYPAGTLSPKGVFNGYPFGATDTIGTRGILSGVVPLARLGRYRLVVWYTDDVGATYQGSPIELLAPITALRLMSQPGQPSTVSTYLKQGGKVWMFGGGAAYATLIRWGKSNTPADDWTNADGELIPGRFMYDFPHWQSSVGIRPARQAILNIPDSASPLGIGTPPGWSPSPTVGRGWSGHGLNGSLSQPNYSLLVNNPRVDMTLLQPRSCSTDPAPPQRFCNPFYLITNFPAEFIGRPLLSSPPNFITEDADPTADGFRNESTLDTLYAAIGGTMPAPLPVMTYYHGFQSPQMVFSGFPIWYFRRAQCIELIDFVMQQIFGLPPPPAGSRGPSGPAPARVTTVPGTGSANPLASSRTAAAPLRR